MVKTAVLVSGGGANLQAILDYCYFNEIPEMNLAAVISSVADCYALERAKSSRVPTFVVERDLFPNNASFCNALLNKLRDLDIELVVTAGFSERLNYTLLHHYKNRVINVQPALFPAFCGERFEPLKALEDTLRLGLRVTGATAYIMGEEDTGYGPIILQESVEVLPDDNLARLQDRIMRKGEWVVLPKAVSLYCQNRLEIQGQKVVILEEPPEAEEEQ